MLPGCLSDSKTVSRCIAQESNEVRVRRCFAAGRARSIKGIPKRVLPAQICHLSPDDKNCRTPCSCSFRTTATSFSTRPQECRASRLSLHSCLVTTSGTQKSSLVVQLFDQLPYRHILYFDSRVQRDSHAVPVPSLFERRRPRASCLDEHFA